MLIDAVLCLQSRFEDCTFCIAKYVAWVIASHEILVGQSVNTEWLLGGTLLQKFPNTGMATAISWQYVAMNMPKILPLFAI